MAVDEAPQRDAAEVQQTTPDPRVERGARRALEAEQEAVMETGDIRTRTQAAERFRNERERERRETLRTGAGAGAGGSIPLGNFGIDDLRFERTDDGVTVEPTESAARERAREQIAAENPGVDPEDIDSLERVDPNPPRSEALPRDAEPFYRPELTEDARRDIARQQIAEQNPGVEPEDIESVERTDDGYRPEFTDEFRTERARKQAATDDPLRDPEDFVATAEDGDVDVRRRQAPLFEDLREDLGGDPPDESPVFRRIQKGSKAIQSGVKKYSEIEQRQDPTTAATATIGDRKINLDEADRGATLGAGSALNVPGAVLDARTVAGQAVEYGQATLDDSTPAGLGPDAQFVQAGGDDVSLGVENQREELETNIEAVKSQKEAIEESYAKNPDVTAGAVAGAVGVGVLLPSSGIAAGRGARRGISRVRTLGAQRVPETGLTQGRTVRVFDPDVPDEPPGARFPGATDRQKYQERPGEAIRGQAERNDPDVIRERFDEAGVEETAETADLYKAVETEPDSSRRGAGGFRSPEVEARDAAETYEVESGTFFGPDLSPNFFRTNFGEPEVSLRPGLPSLGDRPTAFAARGRVREPEADDIRGLERELQSADDPVFRTKPANEINPNEAEVVLPEGTELADIGNRGVVQSAARRLGIGSDFYIEIGNRRIPVRPVADPELTDGGDSRVRQLLADERGQGGAGSGGGDLIGPRRYTVGGRRPPASGGVDRPLPAVGAPADSPGETDVGSASGLAVPDATETEPALSSMPSSSDFSDSGGNSVGGAPVGSSTSSTGASGGSSGTFGGGGGGSSSSFSGGGGGSSTSYGGGGGGSSTSYGGGGSSTSYRRCRDRHTKQEDNPLLGDIALGENEWPNPVAAPDELDDVADDVLGRDEPDRRNAKDLLRDLPGDTDDDRRGSDPLGGFL